MGTPCVGQRGRGSARARAKDLHFVVGSRVPAGAVVATGEDDDNRGGLWRGGGTGSGFCRIVGRLHGLSCEFCASGGLFCCCLGGPPMYAVFHMWLWGSTECGTGPRPRLVAVTLLLDPPGPLPVAKVSAAMINTE